MRRVANRYGLDASALLSLLNSEEGADLVLGFLPHCSMSTVNLAEVVTRLSILGMPGGELHQVLTLLSLDLIPFDEDQAFQAGLLSGKTRSLGLSQGDRACLALALSTRATALTADRAWQGLDLGVEIKLIR
jgi:PIN domain nuclease of toxin-antitoxin system